MQDSIKRSTLLLAMTAGLMSTVLASGGDTDAKAPTILNVCSGQRCAEMVDLIASGGAEDPKLVVAESTNIKETFTRTGPSATNPNLIDYATRIPNSNAQLVHDRAKNVFVLTAGSGRRLEFYDFSTAHSTKVWGLQIVPTREERDVAR